MKFTKWILGLAAVGAVAMATCANAQLGVDVYKSTRTIVVQSPITLTTANTTNAPIDLLGYIGEVKLDLIVNTNGCSGGTGNAPGAGTLTASVQTTPANNTNAYTPVTYQLGVPYALLLTNSALGAATNVYFTDNFNLPGTNTLPTAAYSTGFATPYLIYPPLTNTTAVTITGSGVYSLGFNAQDAGRYLIVDWTATLDKVTNATVSVLLTGYRSLPNP